VPSQRSLAPAVRDSEAYDVRQRRIRCATASEMPVEAGITQRLPAGDAGDAVWRWGLSDAILRTPGAFAWVPEAAMRRRDPSRSTWSASPTRRCRQPAFGRPGLQPRPGWYALGVALILGFASPLRADGAPAADSSDSKAGLEAPGATAQADGEAEARRVQSLTRSIMSPFCPGKTVAACPSPNAQAWREDIRVWVAQGESNDQILQRLQARAPEFDLAGRPGGAWGWGLPLFGVAVASLWLAYMGRRARNQRGGEDSAEPTATAAETPAAAPESALDVKLREELESFET
jgi:cytochrome c-type biogenesis protein CcmH/NrfF